MGRMKELFTNLQDAFPTGDVFCDGHTVIIEFNSNIAEIYRGIFERCALNIKEVSGNMTYHKFDVSVKSEKEACIIEFPFHSALSVSRNLLSYWERMKQHDRE